MCTAATRMPSHHSVSSICVSASCPQQPTPCLWRLSSPWRSTTGASLPGLQSRASSSAICRASADPQRRKKPKELNLPDFFEIDKDAASNALDFIFESAQALETARHYEVVFLVHEEHVDELQDVIQKVKGFIEEKKGKIWRLNDWGMRRLAYKVKKAKRANYILMNIQIGTQAINELNSLLEKDERVIRHLVMTRKQAMTEETVSPPEFTSLRDEEDLDDYNSEEEYESDVEYEEEEEVEETEEKEEALTKV